MIINNLMELINKLFYGDSDDNIYIVDIDERETYQYCDMSVRQIKSYDIKHLDGIIVEDNKVYIKISR